MWPELALGNVAIVYQASSLQHLEQTVLGTITRSACLALDAIIIPNYSAVKPKVIDHRDALPATTTRMPLRARRLNVLYLMQSAFGSCNWPSQN